MVSDTTAVVLAEGHKEAMAPDQSALLEVLDAVKAAQALLQLAGAVLA